MLFSSVKRKSESRANFQIMFLSRLHNAVQPRIARVLSSGKNALTIALDRAKASALFNLSMRAKFLCSLVLVTAGLMCGTLLVVRETAQVHLQTEIEQDTHNAIITFQALQHQHELSLTRKADLLATLAAMRNEDASVIQDPTQDPWRSEDCNLFALADRTGKIVGLHTSTPGL